MLTSLRSGDGPIEGSLSTVRTRDLAATRLNWRSPEAASGIPSSPTGPVRGIEAHAVPDVALATWLPFALPEALALARRGHFDCVITTSPPPSVHLLGLMLQRLGLPWIADFRDGWTVDAPRPPWPLAVEKRLDDALERKLVARADAVTAVTPSIASDLRARLGVDARLLPNGYDPAERQTIDTSRARGLLSPARHSLVHTGRAAISERSPTVVFDALRLLHRTRPAIAARLEVVFAGPVSAAEREQLADPALRDLARTVGVLDRPAALALQQAADSQLVIATGPRERSLATGKLFEYLTAGPPILVVGDQSAAASIVAATGTGFAVPAHSPELVAAGIERLVSGFSAAPNQTAITAYSWDVLAAHMSDLIEQVCARPPRFGRQRVRR